MYEQLVSLVTCDVICICNALGLRRYTGIGHGSFSLLPQKFSFQDVSNFQPVNKMGYAKAHGVIFIYTCEEVSEL